MSQKRFRRFATAALAFGLGVVVLVASVWYLPSASLVPGHSVSWKLGYFGGHPFDPATAMTTAVIPIEASHPGCTPSSGDSWFETLVTYTPVSVTIQIRMTDAAAATCASAGPIVGYYLSGAYVSVQLREPLGGRQLFDGFTFPAAARPYR